LSRPPEAMKFTKGAHDQFTTRNKYGEKKLSKFKIASVAVVTLVVGCVIAKRTFSASDHTTQLKYQTVSAREDAGKRSEFVHDDPNHPWHWTRKNAPCQELSMKKDCGGKSYGDLYKQFHEEGWTVFNSCSLEKNWDTVLEPVAAYTNTIKEPRVPRAKVKEVKDLATDPDTIKFIEFLHGGIRAFPFQTINFLKGTQQPLHSDLVHFDTQPRTLMTAAWVALEDMNNDNGPLRFYPKSHQWGTWDYDEIGMHHKYQINDSKDNITVQQKTENVYGRELEKGMIKAGLKVKLGSDLKKGQTFFWAAGLVHGGSVQKNRELTRLSQVTHYFFEGSEYYWVPKLSYSTKGVIRYRDDIEPCKRQFLPHDGAKEFHSCANVHMEKFREGL